MLPSSLAPFLEIAADAVVARVLALGGARTSKPNGEVSAVRTVTLDGFDEIAAAWSPILRKHGLRIELRAVFCHSRPHVTFDPVPHPKYPNGKAPRRCELADLLIVIDHVDPSTREEDRRAVLVQAKLLKGGSVKPTGQEWVQHELLAWLPEFTFVDSGYDARSRDLRGTSTVGRASHTAEYGGIDFKSSPPEWRHELTMTSAPWLHSPVSLASYLAKMATGGPDCGRVAERRGSDDWSFTVDELLRVTAARMLTEPKAVARGNNNVVGFIADTLSLGGGDDSDGAGDFDERDISDWPEGPIADTLSLGGGDNSDGAGGFDERDMSDWPEGPISTVHLTIRSIDDRSEE